MTKKLEFSGNKSFCSYIWTEFLKIMNCKKHTEYDHIPVETDPSIEHISLKPYGKGAISSNQQIIYLLFETQLIINMMEIVNNVSDVAEILVTINAKAIKISPTQVLGSDITYECISLLNFIKETDKIAIPVESNNDGSYKIYVKSSSECIDIRSARTTLAQTFKSIGLFASYVNGEKFISLAPPNVQIKNDLAFCLSILDLVEIITQYLGEDWNLSKNCSSHDPFEIFSTDTLGSTVGDR
jgi:hypothetical protein